MLNGKDKDRNVTNDSTRESKRDFTKITIK